MHSSIIEIISAFRSSMSSAGSPNSLHTSLKISMNLSHSPSEMFRCLWAWSIGRPVYSCGPPVSEQTICTTRNLKPGR